MEKLSLTEIYSQLKELLEGYKQDFAVQDKPGLYSLSTTKPITVQGKERDGIYFAGLREHKNIVGFYFMPIYTDPELRDKVPAALQKILKGHSCFNVKKLTPEMLDGFHGLMKLGIQHYKAKGWL